MASEVEIFNLALSVLGRGQVTSTTENTREAKNLNRVWNAVRRQVLYNTRWNRATSRWTPDQLESTPESEWDYHYAVPTDCLRVLSVNEDSNRVSSTDVWELEIRGTGADQQQVIATDLTSITIQGILDITNTGMFDPGMDACMANELARRTASSFGLDASRLQYLISVYEDDLSEARSSDGQEGTPKQLHDDTLIVARD